MPSIRSDSREGVLIRAYRFYRVGGWLHFLGLVFLGYYFARLASGPRLVLPLLGGAAAMAFAYGINNYFDRTLDSRGSRKNPIAGEAAASGRLLVLAILPAFVSLATCPFLSRAGWISVCVMVLAGALYSVPPVRLKKRRIVGFAMNGLIFSPLFLLGASDGDASGLALLFATAYLTIPIYVVQIFHELSDAEEDRREGCRTLVVTFGAAACRRINYGLLLVFALGGAALAAADVVPGAMVYVSAGYSAAVAGLSVANERFRIMSPHNLRYSARVATIVFGTVFLIVLATSGNAL